PSSGARPTWHLLRCSAAPWDSWCSPPPWTPCPHYPPGWPPVPAVPRCAPVTSADPAPPRPPPARRRTGPRTPPLLQRKDHHDHTSTLLAAAWAPRGRHRPRAGGRVRVR